MRDIYNVEDKLDRLIVHDSCRELELSNRLLRNQRNAYISGFSIFLSLVFVRLYVSMKQIHEWRNEIKDLKSDVTKENTVGKGERDTNPEDKKSK